MQKVDDPTAIGGNRRCPYSSSDHPPYCQHGMSFCCHECEFYGDGVTDLLPYEGKWTANRYKLMNLYWLRDMLYTEVKYNIACVPGNNSARLRQASIHQQISDLATEINRTRREVRKGK